MQNLDDKKTAIRIILLGFFFGLTVVLMLSAVFLLFDSSMNVLESISCGFVSSYFLFADTIFYLFKHLKNLKAYKVNFILIKDLLIVLIFFIIINKVVKINFILVGAGITIMPVSAVFAVLF